MGNDSISIVMVGHVDHGKSTLIGRLLYDTNSLTPDKIDELKKVSENTGNLLEFAFLLDHLKEERDQGITIDTTQTYIHTSQRDYKIIDAPGHKELVKNMITGAAQADVAVLIVDAVEGVKQQTIRHAYILSLLGINRVVVAINKMDKIEYSCDRYTEVKKDIDELFKKLNLSAMCYVPISALNGENVCQKSLTMNWYRDKTFLETLEELEVKERKQTTFIMPIQDVYKINEKRIAVGRIESGTLNINDKIKVISTNQITEIESIIKFPNEVVSANHDECIGIMTKDAILLERGFVLATDSISVKYDNTFDVSIMWLEINGISTKEKLIIRCNTQETICVIENIYSKINTGVLNKSEKNAQELNYLDAGRVRIKTKKKIVVTKFEECESMGRFVLISNGNICAGGIIM